MIIPLVGAALIALCDRWPDLRETVTIVTAGLLFGTVVMILPSVLAGGRPELALLEMLPGLQLKFTVEPLGMMFALVASGLWIATSIYSFGYMRGNDEHNQTRFYVFFAIALSSTMGVAFSGNLLTLFVCYEVLTLSTYPLVTHHGNEDSMKAGRTYLGILISSSIGLFLLAILWTWNVTGTMDFKPGGILGDRFNGLMTGVLLALYMFGIGKAALMPIHRWLPAAMVAPTPVSALLHAVAVVKTGVFCVVKIIVYVFGIDKLRMTPEGDWLLYVAGFTILTASIIALRQDNLKRRLAYSTVSQLSYIILGAALANSLGIIGGGMHIAMHAFGKITLFFCAGAILVASHKTEISEMDGLGKVMPITFIFFLIGSLSVIGLPPLGGSWSKWYLMLAAAEAGQVKFMFVFMLSSLLNIAYLMPLVARGFFSQAKEDFHHHEGGHHGKVNFWNGVRFGNIREAPPFCLLAMTITSVGCILLFFYADKIYRLLAPVAGIQG